MPVSPATSIYAVCTLTGAAGASQNGGTQGVVTLQAEPGRRTIRFAAVLQSANETLMRYACLDGMGFAFLPKWLVADDLAAGRLERVLPEQLFFAGRLLAVYPSRKYLSVKVRSFLDFIARKRFRFLFGRVDGRSGSSRRHI